MTKNLVEGGSVRMSGSCSAIIRQQPYFTVRAREIQRHRETPCVKRCREVVQR